MPAVDAVLFDLDRTLCVRDQSDEEIHEAVFEHAGIEPFFAPERVHAVDSEDLPTADSDHERWQHVYRTAAEHAGTDPHSLPELADATVFCGPTGGIEPKPDPRPFELALADLDVAAERTVNAGDWHAGDVVGAHNAGMASVWVPTGDASTDPEPEPTHRLDPMDELPSVL